MHRTTRTGFTHPCGRSVPFLLTLLLASCSVTAEPRAVQDAPAEPLRAEVLDELRAALQEQVESRNAGLVALISRGGCTEFFETSWPESDVSPQEGVSEEYRAAESTRYARDTIFPIGSLTMPITSAAALIFIEEGRLALDDPLSDFLPEFSAPRVWVANEEGDELAGTRPAAREIRIADLLAQTSGLSRALFAEGKVGERYEATVIDREAGTGRDLARRLATLPLDFDPGTAFSLGPSADVLGVVLEKVDGRPLQEILEERIFEPLGMRDTAFLVKDPQRVVRTIRTVWASLGSGVPVTIQLPELVADRMTCPTFCSGGHGLYSTASDTLRFGEMLAGGGERDGVRILSEASLRRMTTDRIAGLRRPAWPDEQDLDGDLGFGLGVAVRRAASEEGLDGSVGSFGWASGGRSSFFVDPEHQLVGVLFEGLYGQPSAAAAFRRGVYGALPSGSK